MPPGIMPPVGEAALSERDLADIYAFLHPPGAQAAAPHGRAERGALLYRQTGCYQCHADEAQGGTQGPRIGPEPIPYSRFAWYVRHPTGDMPPYSTAVMSDADIADVYAFLEAQPHPPEVSSIPLLAQ
jgi:mono/diheme cytochrome c family protein